MSSFLTKKYFSSIKKIPNLRKYGEFKFNFKNFINDLPLHLSNIKNRNVDANADLVTRLYNDYMSKENDINIMRRQLNKMKQVATEISKKGGDLTQVTKDAKKHNDDIAKFQNELLEIEKNLMNEALRIPNLTHPESPVGSEDKANIIKTVGEKRKLFYIKYS
jgi:seryl-tRNA synthetase